MSQLVRGSLIGAVVLVVLFGLFFEMRNRLPLPAGQVNAMVSSGAGENGIPAIDQPRFDDVTTADAYLSDDGFGIDLAIGSVHRFYPYQILVWHEIVNDVVNGVPVAVTYDPLCGPNVIFERTLNDTTYSFSVSDKVLNNNLLMTDRQTGSLWSQISGGAIEGSLKDTSLVRLPSSVVSWKTFKAENGDGQVLSRSAGAIRDYTSNPYGDYALNQTIYFPLVKLDGSRPPKEVVVGENGEQMYWFCAAAFDLGAEVAPSSEASN